MVLQLDDLKPFIDWLQANPGLATLTVFCISCAESLAIIGLFIPGTIIMPAIGGMVGTGVLPAYWIIIAAILGAIAGDSVSYWLGYHYHSQIRSYWPFSRVPKVLHRGEHFFNKYGGLSVFIGRFVGPVRPIIPVIAGMLSMPASRFVVANIFSAIAWAFVYMAPGILLGAISQELAPHVAAHLLIILAVAALIIWCVSWLVNKLWNYLYQSFELLCKALWQKASVHIPKLNHIVLHQHIGNYKPFSIILYILTLSIVLMMLVVWVTDHSMVPYIDWPVFLFLRSIDIPPLDSLMAYAYNLTSPVTLCSVGIALAAWLMAQHAWRIFFYWAMNILLAVMMMSVLQYCIPMAPPDVYHHFYTNHSFPSITLGIFSVFLGNFLMLSYYSHAWLRYKKFLFFMMLFVIAWAAVPNLYFGFCWLSSCIAAVICAAISTWVCILFFHRQRVVLELKPLFFIATMAVLIATVSISVHTSQSFIMQLEKPQFTMSFSAEKWWGNDVLPISIYRKNILGKAAEPLSVQYAGNLKIFIATLEHQGWQVVPKASLTVILNRIGAKNRADQLPLFPDLYYSEKPIIVMTKSSDAVHKMLILRLWSSRILLEPKNIPLWIGTVHYHTPWRWRNEKDLFDADSSALLVLQADLAKFPSYLTLPKKQDCQLFCAQSILKIYNQTLKHEHNEFTDE